MRKTQRIIYVLHISRIVCNPKTHLNLMQCVFILHTVRIRLTIMKVSL